MDLQYRQEPQASTLLGYWAGPGSASLGPETPDQHLPLAARSLTGGGSRLTKQDAPSLQILGVGVVRFPDDPETRGRILERLWL